MTDQRSADAPIEAAAQTGEVSVRLGQHAGIDMRVRATPRGILAVGGLVSAILLSTAVLVAVSAREGRV